MTLCFCTGASDNICNMSTTGRVPNTAPSSTEGTLLTTTSYFIDRKTVYDGPHEIIRNRLGWGHPSDQFYFRSRIGIQTEIDSNGSLKLEARSSISRRGLEADIPLDATFILGHDRGNVNVNVNDHGIDPTPAPVPGRVREVVCVYWIEEKNWKMSRVPWSLKHTEEVPDWFSKVPDFDQTSSSTSAPQMDGMGGMVSHSDYTDVPYERLPCDFLVVSKLSAAVKLELRINYCVNRALRISHYGYRYRVFPWVVLVLIAVRSIFNLQLKPSEVRPSCTPHRTVPVRILNHLQQLTKVPTVRLSKPKVRP